MLKSEQSQIDDICIVYVVTSDKLVMNIQCQLCVCRWPRCVCVSHTQSGAVDWYCKLCICVMTYLASLKQLLELLLVEWILHQLQMLNVNVVFPLLMLPQCGNLACRDATSLVLKSSSRKTSMEPSQPHISLNWTHLFTCYEHGK